MYSVSDWSQNLHVLQRRNGKLTKHSQTRVIFLQIILNRFSLTGQLPTYSKLAQHLKNHQKTCTFTEGPVLR